MISIVILIFSNFLIYVLIEKLSFALECKTIFITLKTISKTFKDKGLSEKEKESVLKGLLVKLNRLNLKLIILFFIITSPLSIIYFFYDQSILYSTKAIVISLMFFVIFLFYKRNNLKRKTEYRFFDRLLHKLVLGSNYWLEFSFDIENKLNKKSPKPIRQAYFITGLARSGTTALLELLNKHDRFVSYTYRDMPLILAPNLWRKINVSSERNLKLKERIHKDGIYINANSPEAFDEVFWKMQLKDKYIASNYLNESELSQNDVNRFELFISNFLSSKSKLEYHYLSKNNNQILRIKSLLKLSTKHNFVLLFRDPLEHAGSLLNQHLNIISEQEKDPFIQEYMDLIGHFEFGKNQKVFQFPSSRNLDNWCFEDKTSINYWLKVWLNYYSYTMTLHHPNIFFLSYEQFCSVDSKKMKELSLFLDVDYEMFNSLDQFSPKQRDFENINLLLLQDCMSLYDELNKR